MSIDINPSDTWQTKHNNAPAETVFIIKAGTHVRPTLNPRSGITLQFERGVVCDGQHATAYLVKAVNDVAGVKLVSPGSGPLPKVKDYEVPDREAAIWFGGGGISGANWLVEDIEVDSCGIATTVGQIVGTGGMGIRGGPNGIVRRCSLHHNDQYGIGWGGNVALIEDCDVYENGHVAHDLNKGGCKIPSVDNLTIRGGKWHNNHRNGIWFDIDNRNWIVECVELYDNDRNGLFVEISFNGIARKNLVYGNGHVLADTSMFYGSGIHIAHTEGAEVYENIVYNNWKGIGGTQQARYQGPLDTGALFKLKNLKVHDNTIYQMASTGNMATGVRQGGSFADPAPGGALYDASSAASGNVWTNNTYHVANTIANPFQWDGALNQAGWQAVPQDTTSTFNTFDPASPPAMPAHPCAVVTPPPSPSGIYSVRRARFGRRT